MIQLSEAGAWLVLLCLMVILLLGDLKQQCLRPLPLLDFLSLCALSLVQAAVLAGLFLRLFVRIHTP